jgi:hypothetical protein
MRNLVVMAVWPAISQMKTMFSRLSGLTIFLAANCCLDSVQKASDSDGTNIAGFVVEEAAARRKGGDVSKEAFIANLVANMTVPELGKIIFPHLKQCFNFLQGLTGLK